MDSLSWLIKISRRHFILPFYHTVSNNELLHIKHLYTIKNEKQFRNDLDVFLKHYSPVDVATVLSTLKNGKTLDKPSFLLTFDDGLREIHDMVAPILKEKGVPAVFFLCPAFLDNKELFYRFKVSIIIENYRKTGTTLQRKVDEWLRLHQIFRRNAVYSFHSITYKQRHLLDDIADLLSISFSDYLAQHRPFLTSLQVENLVKDGFDIGSHSLDHPDYRHISYDEQLMQTRESVRFIKERFAVRYSLFSFPYTDHRLPLDFLVDILLTENAFLDLSFGSSGMKDGCFGFHLHRIPMETSGWNAQKILQKNYLLYMAKTLIAKNKEIRR